MAHLTIPPPPVPRSDAAARSVPVCGCVSSAQCWTHRADLCGCASRRRSRLLSRLQHAPCQVCVPDLTQRRCLPARPLPSAATLLRCPHPAGYRCPVAHQQPSPCCPGQCTCVPFSYAQDSLMLTLPLNNLLFLACNTKDSLLILRRSLNRSFLLQIILPSPQPTNYSPLFLFSNILSTSSKELLCQALNGLANKGWRIIYFLQLLNFMVKCFCSRCILSWKLLNQT